MLHALALTARPSLIVEFGASLGISTIYFACALADLGTGRLITTELIPGKARRTESVIAGAGLGRYVEVRAGDARETLDGIDRQVDLLFLDGANDLYLAILELLTPRLSPTAVIAADMSFGDRNHDRYRAHVNDPAGGLVATELRLDAGLVIANPRSADQRTLQDMQGPEADTFALSPTQRFRRSCCSRSRPGRNGSRGRRRPGCPTYVMGGAWSATVATSWDTAGLVRARITTLGGCGGWPELGGPAAAL